MLTVLRVPVAAVSVALPSSAITAVGSTRAIATLRDARGNELAGRELTWSSSDPAVATIAADGAISGVRAGNTSISATSEGQTGSAILTVTPAPVASLTVTLSAASVTERQPSQATAVPRDARGDVLPSRAVAWQSDNERVATITESGAIATHSAGSATITATSEGVSATAVLTVAPAPVSSVTVSISSAVVPLGDTTRAEAILRDVADVVLAGRAISWTTGNPAVAEVLATGVIVTRGVGTTTVTATSEGRSGSAVLTVVPAPVATVEVTLAASSVTAVGATQATALLRDAHHNVLAGRDVTWTSSDASVATVSADGAVSALHEGTTTIAASSEGRSGSASLAVTPAPVAAVTVVLARAAVIAGETSQATASLRDARGDALANRTVTWQSDNGVVASISGAGVVTTHAAGTTTISATSEGVTGTAVLVVAPVPVATVNVTLSPSTVPLGDTVLASAVTRDVAGGVLSGRAVAWTIDNPVVAEVSPAGVIATLTVGTASVTATSEGRSGSAVLTVIPAPVARVDVSLDVTAVTAVGATRASATLRDARGRVLTGRAMTWSSSDPSVAAISADGTVSAVHEGTTTITATSEGRSGSAVLAVTPAPVASVEVVLSAASIWAGQSTQAEATLRDARGGVLSGRAVTWMSDDVSIATVSATGLVTSLEPGRVTITASSEGVSGSVALMVGPAPVATVTVSLASASITAVDATTAVATIRDPNGKVLAGRAVTWTSSADSVATVSAAGLITAERAGSTTITATSEGISGSAELTVTRAPVASVVVAFSRASILAGEPSQATAALTDSRARVLTGRIVEWSSDAPAIATVSASGAITSLAPGAAVIAATSEGRRGEAILHVAAVPVATVTVALAPARLAAGDTAQATAVTLDSAGNALAGRVVTWRSDDTTVATVNASGVVASLTPGTANISATSEARSASAALVVIPPPVASVAIALASSRVIAGQRTRATATTRSARGAVLLGRPVAWASDDPAVATVDTEGVVTGIAPGTANISASSESHSGSVQVTIVPVPVATVNVTIASTSLIEGQATQASAATLDSVGQLLAGRSVTWSSDNTAVATVSSTGAVTTLAPGTVHIVAESEGVSGSATLNVLPIPVARVVVTLGTETIHAGLTTTATAAVFDSAGNQLLNRIVEWSSDNPNVASISSAGLVSAHFQGIAEIGATSGGVTGSRVLTVTPAPIASVTVTLASTVLDVGQGTSAAAVLHDSLGNVLTERLVTWSSDDVAVATVSASGVVTAVGPGSARIIATSEGESGAALLRVTSPAPSAEPIGMTALTQRSFDAVEEDGWMTTPASLPFYTISSDATAPKSPSRVAQIRYPAGWIGGDSPGLTGRDLGNATTIYLSMWVRLSPNWVGHPTGTNKIIHLWISHINRVYLFADGSDANALTPRIGLQRIAGSYDNGFGTVADAVDLRPNLPGQLDVEIVRGRWHHWEVVLTSNTDGLANGTVDWWLDGVHVGRYTGIPFVDATETRTWDYIGFDPTWGGRDGMLDQEQSIFMDHIYVSGKP